MDAVAGGVSSVCGPTRETVQVSTAESGGDRSGWEGLRVVWRRHLLVCCSMTLEVQFPNSRGSHTFSTSAPPLRVPPSPAPIFLE